MEWFKFYNNKWLTDLAVGRLLPEDRLCFITLLCLASQRDERSGVVEHVNEHEIITLTRLSDDFYFAQEGVPSPYKNAIGCLKRMEAYGLIERIDEETILVKNFTKRQESNLTDAERAKKYRDKNKRQKSDEHSKDSVTNVTLDKSREDKSREDISELKNSHLLGKKKL